MVVVLASLRALDDIRGLGLAPRSIRARPHPDGGVWVSAKSDDAKRAIGKLIDRYGTRVWGATGWSVRKPQLRLPGM
jgi:hypothetical protein